MKSDWIKILKEFGLPVLLVLFFVWQGSIREDRMNARMESMESYMRETMTETISKNTEVMVRLEKWLDQNQPSFRESESQ